MITISVHVQPMMNGRIDYVCYKCKESACHYPTMSAPVKCPGCQVILPDTRELYENRMMRANWHFYRVFSERK